MKKTFTTLFVLVWLTSFSAPVNSMLGAFETKLIEGDDIPENPTAADYISDGLVFMLDGIENVDFGVHDDNATRWTDLTSEISYSIGTDNFFGPNYLQVDGDTTKFIPTKDIMNGGTFTFEVVGFCRGPQALVSLGQYPYMFSPYFSWNSYTGVGYLVFSNTGMATSPGACGRFRILSSAVTYVDGVASIWFPKESLSYSFSVDIPHNLTSNSMLQQSNQGSVSAIRLYNRALSEEEIYYNYYIDKARFNIW